MDIADIVEWIGDSGIMEFYLPFILMFAIFYGLLNKSKTFGDPEKDPTAKNINIIVAFVAAMFVMVSGMAVARFLEDFFVKVIILICGVIAFMLIAFTMLPAEAVKNLANEKWIVPAMIVAALLVAGIFIAAGGLGIFGIELGSPGAPLIGLPKISISSEDWGLIILVVLFLALVYFLTREPKEKKQTTQQKFIQVPVSPQTSG
jgi:hypothetical protein